MAVTALLPLVTGRQRSELMEVSMDELAGLALDTMLWDAPQPQDDSWITFEAKLQKAHATALARLRQESGRLFSERVGELVRLLEIEEQTRCHAFQAALMGEVHKGRYQQAVNSILEKLLGKLETFANEPALYQDAAQCLSEYMSALNHHNDLCNTVNLSIGGPSQLSGADNLSSLPAIDEGSAVDYSEDTDTISNLGSEADSEAAQEGLARCVLAGAAAAASLSASGPPPGGSIVAAAGAGMSSAVLDPEEVARERAEARKQKRRESNKAAASKYRNKKSMTQGQLLADNGQLRQQLFAASKHNAVLEAENQLLKQQVDFLKKMLLQNQQRDADGQGGSSGGGAAAAAAAGGGPGARLAAAAPLPPLPAASSRPTALAATTLSPAEPVAAPDVEGDPMRWLV